MAADDFERRFAARGRPQYVPRPSELRADYEQRQREKASREVDLHLALRRARREAGRCPRCGHTDFNAETVCLGCYYSPTTNARSDSRRTRGPLETRTIGRVIDVR